MRSSLLLALPALVAAVEQQQPLGDLLKGWWNKATSYVDSNIPTSIPNPLDAGAAKVAGLTVHQLNASNWKDILTPAQANFGGGPYEWLIYVGGGNKSCFDGCRNATKAWNTAASLLSTLPSAPSLASLDCDRDVLLCSQWYVSPPGIYHVLLSSTESPITRWIPLNQTDVTASDITQLHTERKYEATEPYTGIWQPWTGILAQTGLNIPYGYLLWAFSFLPSWAPMILISLLSRTMFRPKVPQARGGAAAPRAGGPVPAPVPAK